MAADTLIKCLGCQTVVDARLPACPACARCLNCGKVVGPLPPECPHCHTTYCDCCGRCVACGEPRQFEAPPCECGYLSDAADVESLVERASIKQPRGCVGVLLVVGLVATPLVLCVHYCCR
jgi:hypothetical protein